MVFLYLNCTLKLFLFISAGTFLLHPGRPGEQFAKEFQVIIIHVLWNLCEKQFQILIGVNLIGLGCFYKAVKHGAGFCAIVGFHENEVLSADGKRTDSLF